MNTPQADPRQGDELQGLRRLLGSAAADYTDPQLRQLQRDIDVMAELLLDLYLAKNRGHRRSPRRQPSL